MCQGTLVLGMLRVNATEKHFRISKILYLIIGNMSNQYWFYVMKELDYGIVLCFLYLSRTAYYSSTTTSK